jgi:hypothetical protein
MSYIGASPTTAAFPFDQFSGNGTTTAFTMSYAPASTTSIVVSISGVVQNPNTYSVSGLTITFSGAPPTGTNNIGVLFLGLPASGVTTPGNTAYLSTTQFTATAGQTTFTPSGTYQTGFINVIRNGSQLAPTDYTATNGTTVVLSTAASLGDVVVIEVYNLTSVTNALPLTGGTVTGATTFNSTVAVSGASTFSSTVSINGANGSGYTGYKNRIINGGMVIDQRYAGAATANTISGYTVDRFTVYQTVTGKLIAQQNAGSVTPPPGFTNYIGITSQSAYTVLTGDYYVLQQAIEGYNIADFAYGTASASPVTLSFWVRSSLTGTFGATLRALGTTTRSYPFTYSISAANTWEQKTITVAGDTAFTPYTNNSAAYSVTFSLGVGTTYSGAATGSWSTGNYLNATGSVSVVGTSGATFYVTGVQLERGSNATSFEFRDYGRELQMCQRYYIQYQILPLSSQRVWTGGLGGAALVSPPITIPQYMRAAPSYSFLNTTIQYYNASGVWTNTTLLIYTIEYQAPSAVPYQFYVYAIGDSAAGVNRLVWNPTGITYAYISSEL